MIAWWWSYLLDIVGLIPLWLMAKRNRLGWIVGMVSMGLWFVYALVTKQYGFIPGSIVYTVIYIRGFVMWKHYDEEGE